MMETRGASDENLDENRTTEGARFKAGGHLREAIALEKSSFVMNYSNTKKHSQSTTWSSE
jgi:hypothetical protein